MDEGRHERVSDLFLRACELAPREREAFLDEQCAGDPALRAEVESLLAYDGAPLLETGVGGARAMSILEGAEPARQPSAPAPRCSSCDAPLPAGESECPRCRTRTFDGLPSAVAIPGYRIVRMLGEGGMGRVLLAEDTTLGRRVAVKLISESFAHDERAVRRFLREARTMATVEHPHIVRVYSFGETGGCHYLVMEYVEGDSLARRIRRVNHLAIDEALRIARQTVEALEAAWEHGIVHRDVKPANILLDARDRVRVADFGLAKATDLAVDLSVTHAGQILGTPQYVSPEQARGEKDIDFRADVYSLGIVLYEMLAGRPPFAGGTPLSLVDQHLHTPLPSVCSVRSEIPGQVEQLCDWMTRKQPGERPGSYADLRQALDALLGRATELTASGPLPAILAGEDEEAAAVFVGRRRELVRLEDALDRARAGQGQVLFVTGEAGSGKTALIAEFERRVLRDHDDVIVARGNCDAQTGFGDPYLPFREVLALLTGDVESRRASGVITRAHARRLWGLLPVATEALVDNGPDLVGAFVPGEALVARAASFTPSPAGWRVRLEELVRRQSATPRDVTLQQGYLFEQFTRTLQALARHRPLLLQIEDLHWADGGSCGLLFQLGRRIGGDRILIVGTYRPAEVALPRGGERHPLEPAVNELRRAYGDVEVHVGEEESREFIDDLVDHEPNRLGPTFREALFRQTRGHPLFAVELLASMRERKMLVPDEEGRWTEGSGLEWGALPARVEGAIGERIGRLPEPLERTLELASVQGDEFSAEVLAELHGAPVREVVGLLSRELDKRHRLVRAQGVRRVNGRRVSMYRFRHILFQKYLYGRMDEVERTYLHEEAGTALEALYGEHVDEVALQLARHFREAGITDKAIGYLQQAGRKAVQLSANAEAIAHFRDALALVGDLTDTDGRPRAELELQLLLGAPLLATAGPGSADLYLAYSRALELCEQVGDAPQLFQALFLLVHHHANTGGLPAALELATRLVELAESAEEPLPTVMAYWARGFVLHFLGRYEEAARDHERVVDLYDADQHASLAYVFGMDPGVSALTMNGVAYWHLGHPDRARSWCDRGIALAERVGHPSSLAHALTISTSCSLNRGDVASLTEHVEKLVRVSTEKGAVLFAACGVFYEGRLLIERGRSAEGLARMHEGSDAIEQAGSRLARAEILALLAEAHGRANDPAAGLELIDDALAHTEADHDRNFEPGLHALRGELLLQTGQSAKQAEASFRRALEIARARSLKSWELRAAMGLARLSPSVGSADEARELLAGVFGWFTEGFETRDLRAAAKLLDELS